MSPERSERKRPSHILPKFFSLINKNRVDALREEVNLTAEQKAVEERCQARRKLCWMLQEIDSSNPTWRYGEKFFAVFPQGPKAIEQLFEEWGVFNKDGTLNPPEELVNAQPREFLDLEPRTVADLINQHEAKTGQKLGEDFKKELHAGAEEARRASLEEYHLLKSGLLKMGEVPLLARDFIQALTDSTKIFSDVSVCIIGLSIDEAQAYVAKGPNLPPLVGLDTKFSPALKRRIEKGKVQLQPGRIYITKADIREGIPLADNSVVLGALYVLHHIPKTEQKQVLQEMIRVSAKTKEDSPKVALHIFEPLSSQHLLRMVVQTNWYLGNETGLFDAGVGTHICGGQTTESILNLGKEVDPNLPWSAQVYPNLPPVDFFQKNILPAQQVGLKGC